MPRRSLRRGQKKRAETSGSGIVYVMFEGSGHKFHWHIWDLLTDEHTSATTTTRSTGSATTASSTSPGVQKHRSTGVRVPDYDRRF